MTKQLKFNREYCTVCEGEGRVGTSMDRDELRSSDISEMCEECGGDGQISPCGDIYCCSEGCMGCGGVGYLPPTCTACNGKGWTQEDAPSYVHYGDTRRISVDRWLYEWHQEWYGKELSIIIDPHFISYTNPMSADFDPDTCWHRPRNLMWRGFAGMSHVWYKWSFWIDGEEIYNERTMAQGLPTFNFTRYLGGINDALPIDELHRALESCFTSITLRPGDTDEDFFENYTPEMMSWCTSFECEQLSGYEQDLERLER